MQKPHRWTEEAQGKIVMLDRAFKETAHTLKKRTSGQPHLLVGRNRYPESKVLPLDAEKRLIDAVRFASKISTPIQTMLTVNAAHLQRIDADSVFHVGHLWDGFQCFLELLRKWLVEQRGVSWACVWVREYTGGRNEHYGEHWHIAFYIPPSCHAALAAQVAIWTGEAIGAHDGKKKCIARSLTGAWYLSRRKDNAGEYLGKATPKTRILYGRRVKNDLRTSKQHGGEGPIQGKRYGISKTIGYTEQQYSLQSH